MNILYITAIDYRKKTGLYNSNIERLKIIKEKYNIKVFSLLHCDSFFKSKLKVCLNKKINDIKLNEYIDGKVLVTNLIYRDKVFERIGSENYRKSSNKYYISELSNYIDNNKVDLIHAHWAYPQGYIAQILSKKYDIPYIITAHGSDIHTAPLKNKYIKKLTIEALNNANRAMFVSNSLNNIAVKLGFENKNSFICKNGIDLSSFKYKFYSKKRYKTKPIIGFVGNIVDVKGVMYLPEIFKNINEKIKCDFEIVGDGDLFYKLKDKIEKFNIECKFYGHVDKKDIAKILERFDVLVVPSKREGWGSVVLEANSLGIYVIGSDRGGIPEVINKYGKCISIDSQFETKIANEVCKILKLGYDSKKIIEYAKNFSWENIVESEIDIYLDVVNKNNRSSK